MYILIQMRSDSSRLPGKWMEMIGDKPLWRHCYDSCAGTSIPVVVVCPDDDAAVIGEMDANNILCIPGPKDDVLERYRRAMKKLNSGRIIRITGDCPFPNVPLIRYMAQSADDLKLDVLTNAHPKTRTSIDGEDVEIVCPPPAALDPE